MAGIAVVSDLSFTPCTWKNRTHPDIATGRRAARSDILLMLQLRGASGQEGGLEVHMGWGGGCLKGPDVSCSFRLSRL